jgi:hypothetical protein
MTSLRLEYTGTATVWDDLVWGTAPVSGDDAFTTASGRALSVAAAGVLGNDGDADGDRLSAALQRGAANGTVELRPDGSFTYIPRAGFSGVDTFSYRANDGTGNGNDATVAITVQPVPTEIPSTVSASWLAFRTFTRNTVLRANRVPANSRIRVTCKTRRKRQQRRGCPKARTINVKSARSRVNLRRPLRRKRLPAGTTLTVRITTPGAIGKRFRFKTRRRKLPTVQVRCLPPGGGVRRCG